MRRINGGTGALDGDEAESLFTNAGRHDSLGAGPVYGTVPAMFPSDAEASGAGVLATQRGHCFDAPRIAAASSKGMRPMVSRSLRGCIGEGVEAVEGDSPSRLIV